MKGLKFRVWDKEREYYLDKTELAGITPDGRYILYIEEEEISKLEIEGGYILEQYTGLKDKNGKEIYENCELNGRYIVEYVAPSFVGRDITNGDIIELYDNRFTITKEYSEVSQNSEGSID